MRNSPFAIKSRLLGSDKGTIAFNIIGIKGKHMKANIDRAMYTEKHGIFFLSDNSQSKNPLIF